MFIINSVSKITRDSDEMTLIVECNVSNASSDDTFDAKHAYRESDPHGLSPIIKQWIANHPDFPIDPYVPPTTEETRANMPSLTRVKFRTAFKNAGMTTAVIIAAIASVADESEQEDLQIVWEDAQSFKRLDPLVQLIADRAGKTADEIDAIWNAALAIV